MTSLATKLFSTKSLLALCSVQANQVASERLLNKYNIFRMQINLNVDALFSNNWIHGPKQDQKLFEIYLAKSTLIGYR